MDSQSQYPFETVYPATNTAWRGYHGHGQGLGQGHVQEQNVEQGQQQMANELDSNFRYSLPLSPISPTSSLSAAASVVNTGCASSVIPMSMYAPEAWASASGSATNANVNMNVNMNLDASPSGMITGSGEAPASGPGLVPLANEDARSSGLTVHSRPPRPPLFPSFSQPAPSLPQAQFAFNIDYDLHNHQQLQLRLHHQQQEHERRRRRHLQTLQQHPYIHQYSTPPTTPTKVPPFPNTANTNANTNASTYTDTSNTTSSSNNCTTHFNLNPSPAHLPVLHSHSQQHLLPQLPIPTLPINNTTSATSTTMYRTSSSPSSSSSIKRAMSDDDEYTSPHASISSRSQHHHTNSLSSTAGTEHGSNKTVKRQRACVSTKDFIPPDVTGLSKREARLVKNRAAAFLSRQRKREEFEYMEMRVAELEQENARLREAADTTTPTATSHRSSRAISIHNDDNEDQVGGDTSEESELDQLRIQLAAAKQREAELAMQLKQHQENVTREARDTRAYDLTHDTTGVVKSEDADDGSSAASSSAARDDSPFGSPVSTVSGTGAIGLRNLVANPKSGASLGLMVLLCALPSLLSSTTTTHTSRSSAVQHHQHSHHSHHHSSVNRPATFLDNLQWGGESSTFYPPAAGEIGWPGATNTSTTGDGGEKMEVDCGRFEVVDEAQDAIDENGENQDNDMQVTKDLGEEGEEEEGEWRKLEIEGEEGRGLFGSTGLGALDISFVTRRTRDGKIRVRVHSSATVSKDDKTGTDPPMSFSTFNRDGNRGKRDMTMEKMIADAASDLATNPLSLSYVDADPLGPFLGASSLPSPVDAVDGSKPSEGRISSSSLSASSFSDSNNDIKRGTGIGLMDSAFTHDFPGVSLENGHGYGFGFGGIGDFSSSNSLGYTGYGSYMDYNASVPIQQQQQQQQGKSQADGEERKRVRIALKSLPSVGGEGGEWEVEVQ